MRTRLSVLLILPLVVGAAIFGVGAGHIHLNVGDLEWQVEHFVPKDQALELYQTVEDISTPIDDIASVIAIGIEGVAGKPLSEITPDDLEKVTAKDVIAQPADEFGTMSVGAAILTEIDALGKKLGITLPSDPSQQEEFLQRFVDNVIDVFRKKLANDPSQPQESLHQAVYIVIDKLNAAHQERPTFQRLVTGFQDQLSKNLNQAIAEVVGKPADQITIEDIPDPETPQFQQLVETLYRDQDIGDFAEQVVGSGVIKDVAGAQVAQAINEKLDEAAKQLIANTLKALKGIFQVGRGLSQQQSTAPFSPASRKRMRTSRDRWTASRIR